MCTNEKVTGPYYTVVFISALFHWTELLSLHFFLHFLETLCSVLWSRWLISMLVSSNYTTGSAGEGLTMGAVPFSAVQSEPSVLANQSFTSCHKSICRVTIFWQQDHFSYFQVMRGTIDDGRLFYCFQSDCCKLYNVQLNPVRLCCCYFDWKTFSTKNQKYNRHL